MCEEPSPGDPEAPDVGPPGALPVPPFEVTREKFIELDNYLRQSLQDIAEDAKDKFPFALGKWIPLIGGDSGGGECAGIPFTILGQSHEVGICGTPIDGFLAGPGRAALLVLGMLGFYFASARVMTAS